MRDEIIRTSAATSQKKPARGEISLSVIGARRNQGKHIKNQKWGVGICMMPDTLREAGHFNDDVPPVQKRRRQIHAGISSNKIVAHVTLSRNRLAPSGN
jgi:hypothetical protein